MAHFAKLAKTGNKVIAVHTVADSDCLDGEGNESEAVGQAFLESVHGWPSAKWIQTSYNTQSGVHKLGGTAFRGNYAGIGYIWDSDNNIFYVEQPYPSWTLNTTTAEWEPPVAYPSTKNEDGTYKAYKWNESNQSWDPV
jgi:hypothetical protein|tara:strand:- start:3204 stop:3620 length:417 start_codon:yes stop_codon:yes gene_type:complete